MASENHKYTNSLINESSPYLLQHAHNPVNWYAWGDDAFSKAVTENKLIFLSIGYSTCHWCHVMEHESFEDEEVAGVMNESYVSIKVDREERPDLDAVFMDTAMMITGNGGWPLNLILTPEGKPFFTATYIRKAGNSYSMGMMELLPHIENLWRKEPQKLIDASEQILKALNEGNAGSVSAGADLPSGEVLVRIRKAAGAHFKEIYDKDFGGFNSQPKFPQPQNLLLLMREFRSSGDSGLLEMAENTLRQMRAGGIYDHIGFGFHRYSTDSKWLLPHFEKMLYDQAMLILAYTEAFQLTARPEYRKTAEEIIEYVLRDMRSEKGAFYSAEDADSEGREGKFYVWEYDDFTSFLNSRGFDGAAWAAYFSLEPEGNFADEASRTKSGENILHIKPGGLSPEDADAVRELLFREREKCIRPHRDDKILTDWNGLMITALAKAGWTFGRKEYVEAAGAAAGFILETMQMEDGALLHSFRNGKKHTRGMIDDYAFLIRGLLELYRADFDPAYIKKAVSLAEYTRSQFEDKEYGGFFQSDIKQTDILIRKKSLMDNAIPSGNSVMYENLMQLFKITAETSWRDSADAILRTVSADLEKYPSAFAMLLSAFDYAGSSGREILVAGTMQDSDKFIAVINRYFLPGSVVLLKTAENSSGLSDTAGYTDGYSLPDDSAAVYICTDFTCSKPLNNTDDLIQVLK